MKFPYMLCVVETNLVEIFLVNLESKQYQTHIHILERNDRKHFNKSHSFKFLPPAYVVRREVMFSQVCVCSTFGGGGGYPIQLMGGGGGGVPHLSSPGGYPIPGLDGGYPLARTRCHTPQDWMGYPLARIVWCAPLTRTGCSTPPSPQPGLDGVPPPRPGLDGVPPPH